jgi:hypothetical protein
MRISVGDTLDGHHDVMTSVYMIRQLQPWHENLAKRFEVDHAYFWATHQGAELDLLLMRGARRIGVEIKRSDAPALTPSMRSALADLRLDRLWVIYPGERRYALHERVTVVPLTAALAMNQRKFC